MELTLITIGVLLLIGVAVYVAYRIRSRPALKPYPRGQNAPEPQYSLPQSYGEDEIVALVKDPYWLYTYWEVTDEKRKEFERKFGKGTWEASEPLLRLYDLTGLGAAVTLETPYEDVHIDGYANNWYIHVGRPDHTFCIDLGRRLPGGTFVTIARSNVVTTPSDRVSDVIDPQWPPIETIWRTFGPTVAGAPEVRPTGVGSPAFITGLGSEAIMRRKD